MLIVVSHFRSFAVDPLGRMIQQLAKYNVVQGLSLILVKGSVVHFAGKTDKAAIVNAANMGVLGGGGVDGAISAAGGHRLYEDRLKLPILEYEIRCQVGSAVLTGPGDYGELQVPYVIHAVGPNYHVFDEDEYDEADKLLKSAYMTSLSVAAENRIEEIAFSLLSAGIFRGYCTLSQVLGLGVESILSWAKSKPEDCSLSEIYIVAFTAKECITLKKICDKAFGVETQEEDSNTNDMNVDTPRTKSREAQETSPMAHDDAKEENEEWSKKATATVDTPMKETPDTATTEVVAESEAEGTTKTLVVVTSPNEKVATEVNDNKSEVTEKEDGQTETPTLDTVKVAEKSESSSDKDENVQGESEKKVAEGDKCEDDAREDKEK